MSVDYLALLKQKSGHALVVELPKLPKGAYGSKDSARTSECPQNEIQPDLNEAPHSVNKPVPWEQWQAERHSPGTVPLTPAERQTIKAFLEEIDEHDSATRADVLRTAERFPVTKAWLLGRAAGLKQRRNDP